MMPLDNYAAFFIATLAVLVSPGPTVFYLLHAILERGRSHGGAAVAGVVAGDTVAVVASLTGLGALLSLSATAFEIFRYFAAAYLVYLGLRALLAKGGHAGEGLTAQNNDPMGDSGVGEVGVGENGVMRAAGSQQRDTFRTAFLVTALNPKGILFFTAFFPLFISREVPALPQLVLMSVTFVVLGGINAAFYVLATDMVKNRLRSGRTLSNLKRLSGGALVAAGAALLASGVKASG